MELPATTRKKKRKKKRAYLWTESSRSPLRECKNDGKLKYDEVQHKKGFKIKSSPANTHWCKLRNLRELRIATSFAIHSEPSRIATHHIKVQ